MDDRPVRGDDERRVCLRARRNRLQGRAGGVRAGGDDAGREQGAAGPRRHFPRRSRRGGRALQHVVAGAHALGQDELRVRPQ